MRKKIIWIPIAIMSFALLCLIIICLINNASNAGEPGETPTLTITIKNPPNELYYLDLLIPDTERMLTISGFVGRTPLEQIPKADEISDELYSNGWIGRHDASIDEIPRIDDEVKRLLYSYEGWVPAVIDSDFQRGPGIGDSSGKQLGEDMVHEFGYMPPSIFRVIIITESHTITVSDVCEVDKIHSKVTFDYTTKEVEY